MRELGWAWPSLVYWLDLVDVLTVGVLIWLGIRFLRRTRGRRALIGLTLLGGVYLVARALELRLTAAIFQGFFAVLVLVLVVVFQEDLRRLFEQLGSWRRGRPAGPRSAEPIDVLVRTVAKLAAMRTGALIVLPGSEPLESHVEGGVPLGGRASEPLLLSLFDASSPGHDGAVVLRGSRVERFAVHLPLSSNIAALGPGGTRHAAALGLAERCDATCIVVSEERGTISVARDGTLQTLRRVEDLSSLLHAQTEDSAAAQPWWRGDNGRDALLAAAGAVALWLVFVPGSTLTEVSLRAEVRVANLPTDLELESVEPSEVDVTLRGLRRDVVLTDRERDISVHIDANLARLGRRTFQIDPESVRAPETLDVVNVAPNKVVISLRPALKAEGG